MLPPLAAWQNFYVIIGTAAATLTGLMFVVVTLVAGGRVRSSASDEGIATFSTPSIVHFCTALLIAAMFNAPWQALWQASLLLGLCGLTVVVYAIIIVRRTLRQTSYKPVLEDWIWHCMFPFISYTTFVLTAPMLPVNPVPTLFAIAAATVLLLFIGIHNAWDNVTYITTNMFQPEDNN